MTSPTPLALRPATGTRALALQGALLALAAVVLPALGHAAGIASGTLLPMHWPVLLAGLLFGARTGALLGVAAPLAAFATSGMPPVAILPAMVAELAVYGAVAGLRREARLGAMLPWLALALVAGRAAFAGVMALQTGTLGAAAGLAAGGWAALAQLVVLPLLASRWLRRTG